MKVNPQALIVQLETLRNMYAQLLRTNKQQAAAIQRLTAERDRLLSDRYNPPQVIAAAPASNRRGHRK